MSASSDYKRSRELRRKHYNPPRQTVDLPTYSYICSLCGKSYATFEPAEKIPGALTAEGEFVCKNCRNPQPPKQNTPPPAGIFKR